MRSRRSGRPRVRTGERLAHRSAFVKIVYFVAVVVGWALLAAAVGAIWLHYFPGRGRVSTAAASAVPLLIAAGVPALIILALTRRWITVVLTVIALGVGVWTQAPLLRGVADPGGERITVVQANIKLGAGDVDAVVARVRSSGAHLLTIEEMTPAALDRLRRTDLRSMLPYEFAVPGTGGVGTGIFSRYPLRDTAQLTDFGLNNLRADVDLPGAQGTTVFAVHPIPPYPYDPSRWVREMKLLRDTLHASTAQNVIVSGDFNATWDHAQFRALLSNGFRDATEQVGGRWRFTYPSNHWYGPLIGIDHVLARGLTAVSLNTFDVPGSDHRALEVSLTTG
ncbi:endonuclease/exonuclease/phosphatase family protein [Williamsia maris]|uniref:endonuclease/exonuclease/phosphatase family protein n=1 Tax=Williamsia maris TaxID=72806 RepID=UPI0020A38DFB|nr:endonuclease/exonuclease/phosphatase family protein [Williamsia maris]